MHPIRILALCLLATLPSCCCRLVMAQIKLTESKIQTYIGYVNPRVVDGVVYASAGSKPVLASQVSTINVENPDGFKWVQLESIRKSDFASIALVEDVKGVQYRMPPDAPLGTYRITARGFDPEKGFAQPVSIDVLVENITPGPVGPDDPPDPTPDDNLTVLGKASRAALQELASGMAADMESLSTEVQAKRIRTMLEASAFSTPKDVATRTVFKQAMAEVLEPKLGTGALPPDADKIFMEVAAGFRSVK